MKILSLLVEFPFPPNHGFRCDAARRLQGFQEMGWEVHAITWTGGRLEPNIAEADIARMQEFTASLELLKLDRSARRLVNLARWPSQTAGRWPSRRERARLLGQYTNSDHPFDAIWIDGIHAAALGRWLAAELGVPYFYRSHNVEFRYNAEQARLATGMNRLSISANLIGLRRFERRVLRDAALFFDISFEDLSYWEDQGFSNGRLLSTLADSEFLELAKRGEEEVHPSDIAFTGSLSLPNNVAALEWYLAEVHPLVKQQLPDARLVIAGRNPSPDLAARIRAAGGELIANPDRMEPILLGCKTAINPILHGSGVNIKMIDMLASGQPVVSTPKGVRGLAPEIVDLVDVASRPEDLAAAIAANVTKSTTESERQDRLSTVTRHFGIEGMRQSLEHVEQMIETATI